LVHYLLFNFTKMKITCCDVHSLVLLFCGFCLVAGEVCYPYGEEDMVPDNCQENPVCFQTRDVAPIRKDCACSYCDETDPCETSNTHCWGRCLQPPPLSPGQARFISCTSDCAACDEDGNCRCDFENKDDPDSCPIGLACISNGGNCYFNAPTLAPTVTPPTDAPTLAPTDTLPTDTPTTAASTVAPTATPNNAPPTTLSPVSVPTDVPVNTCLSGEVIMILEQKRNDSRMKLRDVNMGDKVLTFLLDTQEDQEQQHGLYEEVYSYGHYNVYAVTSFLSFTVQEQEQEHKNRNGDDASSLSPLEITVTHLVFLHDKVAPVQSEDIRPGDSLVGRNGGRSVVERVSQVYRTGLFSPLVSRGVFVASGAVVSSYTAAVPACRLDNGNDSNCDPRFVVLQALGKKINIPSHHVLLHVAIAPLRVLCQAFGYKKSCNAWDSDGQLLAVRTGLQFLVLASQAETIKPTQIGEVRRVAMTLVLVNIFLSIVPLFFLEQLLISAWWVATTELMITCDIMMISIVILLVALVCLWCRRFRK